MSRCSCISSCSLSLSLSLSAELSAQGVPPPSQIGQWQPAFDHATTLPIAPSGITFSPPVTPNDMFDTSGPYGRFNAIHMSLIPHGPDQGKVFVWSAHNPGGGYTGSPAGQVRVLFWSIFDPQAKTFSNYMWGLPTSMGDLFCAGHAWTDDGNLLIAGGTGHHGGSGVGNGWTGSKLAYLYDPQIIYNPQNPNVGPWTRILPDLDTERWYPTVADLGLLPGTFFTNVYLVLGGSNNGTGINSYQAWRDPPSSRTWHSSGPGSNTWPGPGGSGDFWLYDYPRFHLLSPGVGVTAGMVRGSSHNDHHDLVWPGQPWGPNVPTWLQSSERSYGSSLLFPISLVSGTQDIVFSVGGRIWTPGTILATAEYCQAVTSTQWVAAASLNQKRWVLNTVALPDGSVLAIGGETTPNLGCSEVAAFAPELYAGGSWTLMAASDIVRDYHSTAILLPTGEVLNGGGEWRKWLPVGVGNCAQSPPKIPLTHPVDYQVYQPPYLFKGPRPNINPKPNPGLAWEWQRGQAYSVQYDALPLGVSVERAVLVRPGSVTHHADVNQRSVEVQAAATDPPSNAVMVSVPTNNYLLPRGHYMLFLVSNQGVPSVAAWVKIL